MSIAHLWLKKTVAKTACSWSTSKAVETQSNGLTLVKVANVSYSKNPKVLYEKLKIRQRLETTELPPKMFTPGNLCAKFCIMNLHTHSSISVFTESLLSIKLCIGIHHELDVYKLVLQDLLFYSHVFAF